MSHTTPVVPPSPEVQRQDFLAWENELTLHHDLHRRLGKVALDRIRIDSFANNDPLAPVWTLVREGSITHEGLSRIYDEYVSDIAERSPDSGHYHTFDMEVVDDDLVSANGLVMGESIERSIRATEQDALKDSARLYGLHREKIQATHIPEIVRWSRHDSETYLCFASLCPPKSEVPESVAIANGFKTYKEMASLWIYEKKGKGLVLHALSLDYCTLDRFQRLLNLCGINHEVSETTDMQLARSFAQSEITPEEIRLLWMEILKTDGLSDQDHAEIADQKVMSHPEAFSVYMRVLCAVTDSLARGHMVKDLHSLKAEMGLDNTSLLRRFFPTYRFRRFDTKQARQVMEFTRSRLIPHYVYGEDVHKGSQSEVLHTGLAAATRVDAYEGSCPSSNFTDTVSEAVALTQSGLLGRQAVVDSLQKSVGKGTCLTCGAEKTNMYGCGLCARCNRVWCDEYRSTGRGLSIKEIAKKVPPKKLIQTPKGKKAKTS